MLTKMMAIELGPMGIRVNSVNPTVVVTPMSTHWYPFLFFSPLFLLSFFSPLSFLKN